jgi:hypothetical protein
VGFKPTGRRCSQPGCGAPLRDHILDWEDALPEEELDASEAHADGADLALCLGTSLQITPSCDIPLRTVKAGGRLAILNLQRTPKDRRAHLVLHCRVDHVMAALLGELGLPLPQYVRSDRVLVAHRLLPGAGPEGGQPGGGWGFSLQVGAAARSSAGGRRCTARRAPPAPPLCRAGPAWRGGAGGQGCCCRCRCRCCCPRPCCWGPARPP